jgi:hypothetical protein
MLATTSIAPSASRVRHKPRLRPMRAEPFNVSARGYHAVYREHEANHCPGCGRTHWIIGRLLAECAFCSTALPLEASLTRSAGGEPEVLRRGAGGRWSR